MAKIPVVDFSKDDCLKPGTSSWLSARNDVCRALEDIGCFTAILPNKVPKELANTLFSTFDDLFDFPTSTPEKPFFYATSNSGQRTYGIINGTNPQDVQQFTHLIWPDGNDQFRYDRSLLHFSNI
ncbi:probable 2-oxoglutarate-dependent dioxygenase AOP1.2 [Pyrus x bretschneideri]|uniref:probable 2-oxoglutarate-dependent dioxygenase AOP1.2 n=1 Tax=Pyrus x bretschneideri TaxID=225117 RepID=UPI002030993A|nr:probable 2-oxoglutarate-dependent dioxygenase AOP1.2 [Pyrus x bretschneideri]